MTRHCPHPDIRFCPLYAEAAADQRRRVLGCDEALESPRHSDGTEMSSMEVSK